MANLVMVVNELQKERKQLQSDLSNLDAAIEALGGVGRSRSTRRAGPRRMSADARKRIAAAQRRRWAKWKREQKKS
jgi:hypothetical protein